MSAFGSLTASVRQALAADGKLATTILWPYADTLKVFGGWWRQLWAESLGKDGKGADLKDKAFALAIKMSDASTERTVVAV